MSVSPTAIYPQKVKDYAVQIAPADTTNIKTLVTGPADGTIIDSLIISSSDTSARDVTLYKTISSVNYPLCTISIPATAGTVNGVPSVDVLRSANIPGLANDSKGNRVLLVPSGTTLGIAAGTTVTTAKAISAVASAGDFS